MLFVIFSVVEAVCDEGVMMWIKADGCGIGRWSKNEEVKVNSSKQEFDAGTTTYNCNNGVSMTVYGRYKCTSTGYEKISITASGKNYMMMTTSTVTPNVSWSFGSYSSTSIETKQIYLYDGQYYPYSAQAYALRSDKNLYQIEVDLQVDGSSLTNSNSETCCDEGCWNGNEVKLHCQPTAAFDASVSFAISNFFTGSNTFTRSSIETYSAVFIPSNNFSISYRISQSADFDHTQELSCSFSFSLSQSISLSSLHTISRCYSFTLNTASNELSFSFPITCISTIQSTFDYSPTSILTASYPIMSSHLIIPYSLHDISSIITLSFSDFSDKSYDGDGGVFRVISYGQLILDHCNFSRCSADYYYGGGAVCCRLETSNSISKGVFRDCSFIACNAYTGGGVYWYCSASGSLVLLNMSNCLFQSCNAVNAGGGIDCGTDISGESAIVEVIDCLFDNCSCPSNTYGGGGLCCCTYIENWTVTVDGCLFANCTSIKGGGIRCLNYDSNTPILTVCNSYFLNCSAKKGIFMYVL